MCAKVKGVVKTNIIGFSSFHVHRLCCDQSERHTVDEIKAHPFFRGINWETIRQEKAPFIPQVRFRSFSELS